MVNKLEYIFSILNEVIPGSVYYAYQVKPRANIPFIVYQEVNKRNTRFADDAYLIKVSTIQITLISDKKDLIIEKALEDKLTSNNLEWQLISEFYLSDSGLYRIYEIKMEEYKYEQ